MLLRRLDIRDLRRVQRAGLDLDPGLNVFLGRNAQGKTTVLEGVGLISRGRSFRSDDVRSAIRQGERGLLARAATCAASGRETTLEVELGHDTRVFRVDGREVPPREYQGRLEVVLYSTERLRVVRGAMRERRQFLDRGASALWPSYRQSLREFERVLLQRNAALQARGRDIGAWTERILEVASALRFRRAEYARRLSRMLARGFRPRGEHYEVRVTPGPTTVDEAREALREALERARGAEQAAGRSLVGPHRDTVLLLVDGSEAEKTASAGQARSLLLALALAALEIYREERGEAAIALLDDLDSELDEERAEALCGEVAARGQAFVTTAHSSWAAKLRGHGRIFEVEAGEVRAA